MTWTAAAGEGQLAMRMCIKTTWVMLSLLGCSACSLLVNTDPHCDQADRCAAQTARPQDCGGDAECTPSQEGSADAPESEDLSEAAQGGDDGRGPGPDGRGSAGASDAPEVDDGPTERPPPQTDGAPDDGAPDAEVPDNPDLDPDGPGDLAPQDPSAQGASDAGTKEAMTACPDQLVCSDGSCPRLHWTFEDPGTLEHLVVSPNTVSIGIDSSGIATEGEGALRIELELPATDSDGVQRFEGKLMFLLCPREGARFHTVNLTGRRPWYNFRFDTDGFPPGAQAVLSQFDGVNIKPMAVVDSKNLVRNGWRYADPADARVGLAPYDEVLGPEVAGVVVSLSIGISESWTGTILIDNLQADRTGPLTPQP